MTSDRKIKVSFKLDDRSEPIDVESYERSDAKTLVEEVSSVPPTLARRKAHPVVHASGQYQCCPSHR